MTAGSYEIGRDANGLTEKERQVLGGLREKKSFRAMGREFGISAQRCHEIAGSLITKGVVAKTPNGYAAIVSFEEQAALQRLAANDAPQDTITPDSQSHEATEEAHN
ncbi:helix-turn-helix DNA-binding domain protein [Arthrobacter phage Kitkat]|uniref:Helix-turn-helix DNA-binding domain protein n=2 Tax=Kelleziovirus kitkat TaxID=1982238 RepID=A0A140G6N6_9CAUD|nr:HTH DNA binding protein [Arthrobacter phage Kitkat]AMM44321.1 helix-turn-helix DNA-binding domain protein [Arthrobacter phage Kitkat]QGJ96498.1 helix-turn-helix DNA-binding domain protein [Arthrobacter phage BeatusComedenti]